jgi:hypothetical protein
MAASARKHIKIHSTRINKALRLAAAGPFPKDAPPLAYALLDLVHG